MRLKTQGTDQEHEQDLSKIAAPEIGSILSHKANYEPIQKELDELRVL